VFDQAGDMLGSLREAHVIGFDYTEFLDYAEARVPLMMVLLDLMEELIDGRRIIYVIQEFWKALSDPYFAEFAKTKQKVIRKQNGLGIFDTQSPSDVLKHANGRTMVEQSVTKICLANPGAVREEYVDGFGLTEAEFEIVRTLGHSGPNQFLVKQGHRSAICQLDLSGLDDYITILSGTTDNVALLDAIRAQVGDDPNAWLPPLIQQVRARRAQGGRVTS
jgi:type IV secretion system protein VirB4